MGVDPNGYDQSLAHALYQPKVQTCDPLHVFQVFFHQSSDLLRDLLESHLEAILREVIFHAGIGLAHLS